MASVVSAGVVAASPVSCGFAVVSPQLIAEKANVPVQRYVNRADLAGGSTLGNILTSQVSVDMADIGLAQLAMHSAMETAGARDVNLMVTVLRQFYETHLIKEQDGWSVN